MLSLVKQSYNDFDFKLRIKKIADPSIFPKFTLMTMSISNPYVISYSLVIKILCIIYLHFIDN